MDARRHDMRSRRRHTVLQVEPDLLKSTEMHDGYRSLVAKFARVYTRRSTRARLAAIVCAMIFVGAASSTAQVLTESSTVTRTTSDPVLVTITSVDDNATVIVNGTIRLTKTFSNTTQSVDITPYLVPGANIVQFEVANALQSWSYSWRMTADGATVIDDRCAIWNTYPGCANNNLTVGIVYRHSVTVNSPAGFPPLIATMTEPPNGTTAADLTRPIQWTSVPNAQAYYLY